jgi:hypothetical protein
MQSWQIADLQAWAEEVNGWPGLFVQLPPPDPFPPPLAFFVAIVLQATKSGSAPAPTAAVFTLERTMEQAGLDTATTGVLCGWTADGTHENYGQLVQANRRAFVAAVAPRFKEPAGMALLSEVLATPQGTNAVRGRSDVLVEFGISDDEFVLRYKSYFLALTMSGAQSNWNDEIEEYARSLGALRESEISLAKSNLHQAVVNRIIVRFADAREHGSRGQRPVQSSTQPQEGEKKPWWKFW